MTYTAIIQAATRSRLNLSQPKLRLLPPVQEEPVAPLTSEEILTWAKNHAAAGREFRGVRKPAPQRRRRTDPSMRYLYLRDGTWCLRLIIAGQNIRRALSTDLSKAQSLRDKIVNGELSNGGQA